MTEEGEISSPDEHEISKLDPSSKTTSLSLCTIVYKFRWYFSCSYMNSELYMTSTTLFFL